MTTLVRTAHLKKGSRLLLRSGLEAVLDDNARTFSRVATVYGAVTERGCIQSWEITYVYVDRAWRPVHLTQGELKARDFHDHVFRGKDRGEEAPTPEASIAPDGKPRTGPPAHAMAEALRRLLDARRRARLE